ncbi:hypothetical protein Q8G47_28215, partial [Klebsiella pneumoniae]
EGVLVMDSTHTMLLSMLQNLSMVLGQLVVLSNRNKSSPLSWLRPLTKPQVDGQVHQMVHMHGDIAL